MKYLEGGSFSVHLGSKAYADNYDAVFGKKDPQPEPEPAPVDERDLAFDAYVTGLVREGQRHPIYKEIEFERLAQDTEHGGPDHDDTHEPYEWAGFISEHLLRARGPNFRKQMIRVAALAVAAIEVHDRKGGGSDP